MEQTIKTLSKNGDIVQCVENFITRQECAEWIKTIYSPQLDARFTLWVTSDTCTCATKL